MRYLVAILLPWLAFFTMGKVIQGILCLLLQITLIGWLPASLWALLSVANYHADLRTERTIAALTAQQKVAGLSVPLTYSPVMTVIAVIVVIAVVYLGMRGIS